MRKFFSVLVLISIGVLLLGCGGTRVKLPIDSEEEAVLAAKGFLSVEKFIEDNTDVYGTQEFVKYDQGRKAWVVEIVPRGDMGGVKMMVIISPEGKMLDKKYISPNQ